MNLHEATQEDVDKIEEILSNGKLDVMEENYEKVATAILNYLTDAPEKEE